jgi:aminoglycoside phosphotransferase (APT) family kinase protein
VVDLSVDRWRPYDESLVEDERSAAETLARFVLELRSTEVVDSAPPGGRDPLHEVDEETRIALRAADGEIDAAAALRVWDDALSAPRWEAPGTWVHSDLLRPNLLVAQRRLIAVIDFGAIGLGDPASDLTAAWAVFGPTGRAVYREMLEADDRSWARGRGIALSQAALIIPYYARTNPGFVRVAKRTVEEIIEEFSQHRL